MRPRPRHVLLVLLWALLSVGTAWVHLQLWSDARLWPAPPFREAPLWVRGAGGILQILMAPGWAFLYITARTWATYSVLGAALSSAIGWAFWFGVAWLVTCARRWVRTSPRRRRESKEEEWVVRQDHAPSGDAAASAAIASSALSTDSFSSDSSLRPPRLCGESPSINLSRRALLLDGALALSALAAGGALIDAAWSEPWGLKVRRYAIPIADLPASLDGLRLVQVCDTHLGPRIPASFIKEAVELARSLAPDVFLLTGDYVHDGVQHIEPGAALFAPLVATGKPVVGVLGNHDWYANGYRSRLALAKVGIRVIEHTRVFLDASTRTLSDAPVPGLCLAGFGDLLQDHINVDRSLADVPRGTPRIVLSHNPDAVELVSRSASWRQGERFRSKQAIVLDSSRGAARIDAMFSGHTHGGQIALPGLGPIYVPSRFGTKYEGGLIQGPRFPIVVSRGVGMSILPVRFGVPPEIIEVTLKRA